MARVRANFWTGTLSSQLLSGATTLMSAALASFPAVSGGDVAYLVIDASGSTPEIVKVTAHTSGATTATIVRGQDSTTDRTWAAGTAVAQNTIASDLDGLLDTSDIGSTVQAYDADTLKADTADQLTAGFSATDYAAGTKSSGTYTPDPANGNFQVATNGGAHTLAPPSSTCTVVIHYTNNGSAGTITTSGFTLVDGDSLTTTNGHEFLLYVTKINDVSAVTVKALQ